MITTPRIPMQYTTCDDQNQIPIVTQHKRGHNLMSQENGCGNRSLWSGIPTLCQWLLQAKEQQKAWVFFEKSYGIIHFGLVKRFGRSGLTTWEAFAILLFCSNVNSIPNYRLYYQNSLFPYSIYSAKEQSSYCNIQPTHFVCLCGNTLHNNSLNHPQK